AGKLLGFGKDEKAPSTDPEHDRKLEQALAKLDEEEKGAEDGGEIEREDAEEVARTIRAKFPAFQSIVVVEGPGSWDFEYVASPRKRRKGGRRGKLPDVSAQFHFSEVPQPDGGVHRTGTGTLGVPGKVKRHRSASSQRR